MTVEDLIERLKTELGAETGHGPQHPTNPCSELQKEQDEFLREYTALNQDKGYVDFLRIFSGASIEDAELDTFVDVFGFSGIGSHLTDTDGPIVDENGFLIFAQCIYSTVQDGKLTDSYEHDFAFSVLGDRPAGVYRCSTTLRTTEQPFLRYADDFCTFLERLIDAEGIFERPNIP